MPMPFNIYTTSSVATLPVRLLHKDNRQYQRQNYQSIATPLQGSINIRKRLTISIMEMHGNAIDGNDCATISINSLVLKGVPTPIVSPNEIS